MKAKFVKWSIGLVAGLLFAGCSAEDQSTNTTESLQEIKLTNNIVTHTRGANLEEQSTLISATQKIGVTIIGASSTHTNVQWSTDGYGRMTNEGEPVYYKANAAAQIYAYQPYNPEWTNIQNGSYPFSVNVEQSGAGYANSDLLWATPVSATRNDTEVNLTFNHVLSKINVSLSSTDGTDVSKSDIYVCGTNVQGTFTTTTDADGTRVSVVAVQGTEADVTAGKNTSKATAIIIPQLVAQGTSLIRIVVDGKELCYRLPSARKHDSGFCYNYQIKVNAKTNEVELEDADVNEWEQGGNQSGDAENSGLPGGVNEYLNFTALEHGVGISLIQQEEAPDNNITSSIPSLSYSYDKKNWIPWDLSQIALLKGETVYFKGNNLNGFTTGINGRNVFSVTRKAAVNGNIMSLLYGDDFSDKVNLPTNLLFGENGAFCFFGLFENAPITSAPVLPATAIGFSCYCRMFRNCVYLTKAPELPATTLSESCYARMFDGCSALVDVPAQLPATKIFDGSYVRMFAGCESLVRAPEMKNTEFVVNNGCEEMFMNCTSLKTAPKVLAARTVGNSSYRRMFFNCSSLEKAPEILATSLDYGAMWGMFALCVNLKEGPSVLPAPTLAGMCYAGMFGDCENLVSAPELPATTLAESCYVGMFQNCKSLTVAPDLIATTTVGSSCYQQMFQGCTNLSSAKVAIEEASSNGWGSAMFDQVSPTGTIYKKAGAAWAKENLSIPDGWEVVEY